MCIRYINQIRGVAINLCDFDLGQVEMDVALIANRFDNAYMHSPHAKPLEMSILNENT